MEMHTRQPVRGKIRGAVNRNDMRMMMLRAMLKSPIMPFLFNPRAWFREATHPGDC